MNRDVVEALRRLQMTVSHAAHTSADRAAVNAYSRLWLSIVNAAAGCASDLEQKKVAPGAATFCAETKTANDRPLKDTYIIARHIQGAGGIFQAAGDTLELACGCAAVLEGLAVKLPKKVLIAAILTGCDHSGITVDELVRAHGRVCGDL